MKISKVAAGVAGAALVLGAASTAVAAPQPGKGDDKPLAESNTVSKTTVTNPGEILDVKGTIGKVSDVTDNLQSKNDLNSKTNAFQSAQVGR